LADILDLKQRKVIVGKRLSQEGLDRLQELHLGFVRRSRNGHRTQLHRCDLTELQFIGKDFSDSEMTSCDFRRSNMTRVILRAAVLHNADSTMPI
jgi:uncharacterized protein YjbI with pentapeptide repeats